MVCVELDTLLDQRQSKEARASIGPLRTKLGANSKTRAVGKPITPAAGIGVMTIDHAKQTIEMTVVATVQATVGASSFLKARLSDGEVRCFQHSAAADAGRVAQRTHVQERACKHAMKRQ